MNLKKILLNLFTIFFLLSPSIVFSQCEVFVDGYCLLDAVIIKYEGIPTTSAPATSNLGESTTYFDSTLGKQQCSEDSGAYTDCISAGTTLFTGLTDTPASYSGDANECVKVNGGENALIFGSCAASAASVPYDDITTPDSASRITFETYSNTWNTANILSDFFTIESTVNFGDVSMLKLFVNGSNPTDGTMLEIVNTDANVDSIIASNFALTQAGALSAKGITDTADTATNIATGTTGTRPGGSIGDFRYNTSIGVVELYVSAWEHIYTNLNNANFVTVDTGQGANELYAMDQDVQIADDVAFASVTGAFVSGATTVDFSKATSFFLPSSTTITTDTKCIWFEDPTSADDFESIWTTNGFATTLTKMWCESDFTVNFDFQIDDGSPADVNGSDLLCFTTPAEDESLSGDTTMADGDRLDIVITSTVGTPTWGSFCWTYELDE